MPSPWARALLTDAERAAAAERQPERKPEQSPFVRRALTASLPVKETTRA